jgi:hypothetical protein
MMLVAQAISVPAWLVGIAATLFLAALGALITLVVRITTLTNKLDNAIERLTSLETRFSDIHDLRTTQATMDVRLTAVEREHDREPTGRHNVPTPVRS